MSFLVDLTSERIAAALGENLKSLSLGVIPPDLLAHGPGERFLIQARAHDAGGHRAALAGIEPAVRAPTQAVDHRVRVLEPKTGKNNFRITVRDVVVILVGIKKKIRRVQYPNATAPFGYCSSDVKTFNERLV